MAFPTAAAQSLLTICGNSSWLLSQVHQDLRQCHSWSPVQVPGSEAGLGGAAEQRRVQPDEPGHGQWEAVHHLHRHRRRPVHRKHRTARAPGSHSPAAFLLKTHCWAQGKFMAPAYGAAQPLLFGKNLVGRKGGIKINWGKYSHGTNHDLAYAILLQLKLKREKYYFTWESLWF